MIQASIYGRLGRDPEQRITANGNAMAFASMAVDVSQKNGDRDSEWIKVVAFGKQADELMRHQKGDLLAVMGPMSRDRWTGKDGQERATWSVIANALMSARTVRPGGGSKRSDPGAAGTARPSSRGGHAPLDDEIPF